MTSRAQDSRAHYHDLALRTQATPGSIWHTQRGRRTASRAPYLSYRRDLVNTSIADHWYVALQVRADAAMVALGEDRFRCNVEKTFTWMEWLWSPAHAGYAPRADLDGANPTLQDVYADDNAVIGLAFLDVARVTRIRTVRARALAAADRAARYPIVAGLWDGEFGGGLWWTNQRDGLGEGKPAQSTALLAHVMAELYAETANPVYRQHALDSLAWLDAALWSEHHQLYAYSVDARADDPSQTVVTQRYFGYDQAIVIQALLTLHRLEPDNPALPGARPQLGRGRRIGTSGSRSLAATLSKRTSRTCTPSYGVWISEAFLDLYAVDGDRYWLERARANFDALDRALSAERHAAGTLTASSPAAISSSCTASPASTWGVDHHIYSLSQAMMQRVAARLAAAS